MRIVLSLLCVWLFASIGLSQGKYDFPVMPGEGVLDSITFPGDREVYVSGVKLAEEFGVSWSVNERGKTVRLGELEIPLSKTRQTYAGSHLVSLGSLVGDEFRIEFDEIRLEYLVLAEAKTIVVGTGKKRVEINLVEQKLLAFQGNSLILETNISSGKPGHRTPPGHFIAGPEKSRMRYSSKYENSPMPYSLQVHGDIFIHGHASVPKWPASHGCIRMPLTGKNAAKHLFAWVEVGMAVSILTEWSPETEIYLESVAKLKKIQKSAG